MVTKKFACTDTKLFGANEILDTGNRVYQGLILKDGLNWLNLKKENRMHWKKEGLLQSF